MTRDKRVVPLVRGEFGDQWNAEKSILVLDPA